MTKHEVDRLYVESASEANGPNYVLQDMDGRVLARVSWLSLQPSGTPVALGGSAEFGGDSRKTVKYANINSEATDTEGCVIAAGARIHLQRNV